MQWVSAEEITLYNPRRNLDHWTGYIPPFQLKHVCEAVVLIILQNESSKHHSCMCVEERIPSLLYYGGNVGSKDSGS